MKKRKDGNYEVTLTLDGDLLPFVEAQAKMLNWNSPEAYLSAVFSRALHNEVVAAAEPPTSKQPRPTAPYHDMDDGLEL